jgi:tetraacyldisaccharide 4'-kinase
MNSALYILLYPLYFFYLSIISIRNLLYDRNILSANKIDCKVISVGNISFGGTGKTPLTIALAKKLQSKYRVAILSRGYKRDSRGTIVVTDGITKPYDWNTVGDEPFLMSQKLSSIPIVVDEDRSRGGNFLVNKFKPDIILLDDGFQQRNLHRDLDIVLLDVSNSNRFNCWREPFGALNRSDILLLTKVNDKRDCLL